MNWLLKTKLYAFCLGFLNEARGDVDDPVGHDVEWTKAYIKGTEAAHKVNSWFS